MKGNQEIYQKTDVEHVFDGLGETPRIQYEVEVVQRSSSVPSELADQTFKGLRDQFLGSILRAGVAPVLVDVQGAGLPQSRVGTPGFFLSWRASLPQHLQAGWGRLRRERSVLDFC